MTVRHTATLDLNAEEAGLVAAALRQYRGKKAKNLRNMRRKFGEAVDVGAETGMEGALVMIDDLLARLRRPSKEAS